MHCTDGNPDATIPDIKREFRLKGWKSPGYHYVVLANGNVHSILPCSEIANGAKGYNYCSIHIAWTGGLNGVLPIGKQYAALVMTCAKLAKQYPNANIVGHNEINPQKLCPLINMQRFRNDVLDYNVRDLNS